MPDFSADRSLVLFVLLNLFLFTSAWFFAVRRLTSSRSQALLDMALLGYAVQYVAVGLPGMLGCLRFFTITVTALIASVSLGIAGRKSCCDFAPLLPMGDRTIVAGIVLFVAGFTLTFAHSQANLPVISNDAMTYHFPAAVQWLQQRRIGLFQTWFFNPANTYSPLAGSMFIAWMIAPFHSDVIARFVEIPALLCVGIALYRLCRELKARPVLAALVTAAAVLSRPLFLPCMMGKDDLFVAFFFIAALVAMSPDRSLEKFSPARFGIALGLLLATKYTALLSVPILLIAIDGPRWGWRGWITAMLTAAVIAGPWYLRNLILTGNPIFPMFSLFTTAPSEAFHPWRNAVVVLVSGSYGMPVGVAVLLLLAWLRCCAGTARSFRTDPLLRACTIGIPLGCVIFFAQSPFPEVRFMLPVFLLLFAASAAYVHRLCSSTKLELLVGIPLLVLSLLTVFGTVHVSVAIAFSTISLVGVGVGMTAMKLTQQKTRRWVILAPVLLAVPIIYTYIHWTAWCRDHRETLYDNGGGYAEEYPDLNQLWKFVDENLPAQATMAYTNLYLIYPLQGPFQQRRLIYIPTRSGVKTIADIGGLGRNLSGEKLVPAAIRATVSQPNESVWISNLKKSGAMYLIIGHGGVTGVPPEAGFVADHPMDFHRLFAGPAGDVYAVQNLAR